MAARASVTRWVDTLSPAHLMCRDLGHAWQPEDAWYDKEKKEFRRELRCIRCRTKRMQWITPQGGLSRNTYTYPQGYRAPDGTGFLSAEERAAIRLADMRV